MSPTGQNHRHRERAQRRAATTVEFALVCGAFFMFMLGAIEFARANQALNATANAAYQGCRSAIIPGATAASATSAAKSVLDASFLTGATITVSPSTILTSTDQVTVTVAVPMNQNSWLAKLTYLSGSTITRSCTLTREKTN
ncbi:MAG: TadE/TadG family type IV pilus assembly protein [Pirellulaceae bacterium]|nr:TadE/TadG family type IV pilus assembly protein [Pirellulaceae bacterium]